MACRIFASYNLNDGNLAHSIRAMPQENCGSIQGQFFFATDDVSQHGDSAIEDKINNEMRPRDTALFVVGNNNHNSPWIDREAQITVSRGLQIAVMQLPHTTGAPPRQLRQYKILRWSADEIARELNTL